MIFGSYPCCDGTLSLSMPDESPAYFPEDCPHCGARVWHRLSRVQSTTWMEADFLAEFVVDDEAHTVVPKPGTEAERFHNMNRDLGAAVANGSMSIEQAMLRAFAAVAVEGL